MPILAPDNPDRVIGGDAVHRTLAVDGNADHPDKPAFFCRRGPGDDRAVFIGQRVDPGPVTHQPDQPFRGNRRLGHNAHLGHSGQHRETDQRHGAQHQRKHCLHQKPRHQFLFGVFHRDTGKCHDGPPILLRRQCRRLLWRH